MNTYEYVAVLTSIIIGLGISYPLIVIIVLMGCAIAAFTRNEQFQRGFAIVALGTQVYQAVAYNATIG